MTERKLRIGGFGLSREGQGNEFRGKGGRRGVVLKLMKGYGMVGTFGRCGRGEEGEGKFGEGKMRESGNGAAKIGKVKIGEVKIGSRGNGLGKNRGKGVDRGEVGGRGRCDGEEMKSCARAGTGVGWGSARKWRGEVCQNGAEGRKLGNGEETGRGGGGGAEGRRDRSGRGRWIW